MSVAMVLRHPDLSDRPPPNNGCSSSIRAAALRAEPLTAPYPLDEMVGGIGKLTIAVQLLWRLCREGCTVPTAEIDGGTMLG